MIVPVSSTPTYFHDLSEGIILVERGRVVAINKAAAMFLSVTGDVVGFPLIGVVRDHRLEQAFTEQREIEVEKAGRN